MFIGVVPFYMLMELDYMTTIGFTIVISSDLHPPTFMYNTIHVVEISTIQY